MSDHPNRVFVVENEAWLKKLANLEEYSSNVLDVTEKNLPSEDVTEYEYGVVFADDKMIQTLNHQYRQMDKPTNVLSFENQPGKNGDIILALETILKECKDEEKDFKDHLAHLLIHGRLHLAGFDHIEDDEAECMEALESKIMSQLGYPDPWKNNSAALT